MSMLSTDYIKPIDIEMLTTGLQFPEGPAFTADGTLWAVELKGERLVCYKNGQLRKYTTGGAPNGIAIDKQDSIWFCDAGQNAVRKFEPANERIMTIINEVESQSLAKPNDLAFDSMGNLVFTCPGDSRTVPDGYACALLKDGTVKKITSGKYFPNGLAFTPDGRSLVMAETYRHRLWKGDWDAATATWYNEYVWCNIGGPDGPGGPDGMAFDVDGHLYVAVFGTGEIRVADNNGNIIKRISLPGKRPTNCAFDPSGKLGLVVTEAETGSLLSIKEHE